MFSFYNLSVGHLFLLMRFSVEKLIWWRYLWTKYCHGLVTISVIITNMNSNGQQEDISVEILTLVYLSATNVLNQQVGVDKLSSARSLIHLLVWNCISTPCGYKSRKISLTIARTENQSLFFSVFLFHVGWLYSILGFVTRVGTHVLNNLYGLNMLACIINSKIQIYWRCWINL